MSRKKVKKLYLILVFFSNLKYLIIGEMGDKFYIILKGQVGMYINIVSGSV